MKRAFVMYRHYQERGLRSIPFLSPDADSHAKRMASWLRSNERVTHAAASFQTLRKGSGMWRRHLRYLGLIAADVPRDLVWVLIGVSEDSRGSLSAALGDVRNVVARPKFDLMRKRHDRSQELAPGQPEEEGGRRSMPRA
jgi:hypothetical protein